MTKIGSVIDGKYEILREIGKGGMSVVYLAMDTHLNKQWAVKEIRKKGVGEADEIIVNSLLAEANMMKKLDHPSLPRIVDIIDNGTTIYVVMDYIEGESLDKVLAEYGAQPEELVIGWAKQLCDALDYLHSQKPPIIYRDMKPSNIMLKPEGNIKIIDFGIAREYKEQTLDTTVLGTKGYAPPEQYAGQTDNRSDIYALGMTMHHLLTGINPKTGESYAPVRMWNPELSEGIELIVDKCVQIAPENRYQNCQDLLYDLEHPDLITRGYKKKQKRKLSLFIATFALSVICLLSGFVCSNASTNINNSNYDVLVEDTSTASSLENKIENYKRAIEIYPSKIDAYVKMLQAYEDEGKFSKAENDEFLALYNANKNTFNSDNTSNEIAELNYKAGMMYFNYYTNDDGSYSFATRVQKAYSFFNENYENRDSLTFENQEISDCYYHICTFYKTYILSSATVAEASKENYEQLFTTIESAMESVEEAGVYDQLSLYNGTFMLLYDQRSSMLQVNIEQEKILSLMEKVYESTSKLTVQKEQSKKLQQEIIDNYNEYKQAIERAYTNAEERN